jgi:hypothetical protein
METVRVIYHHEADSYTEVVKLAEEGIPFALERPAELEHYVPAGERVPA